MNRSLILRFSLVSTLAAVTLPLAAQTPATTVIISCVSKLSGVSRIVAAASACNATVENVVIWNQQGPTGPQGPQGPKGAPGANGTNGAGYAAYSSSSQSMTIGSHTFTVPAGLAYVSGDYVRVSYLLEPSYYLEGTINSYSGTTLQLNVTALSPSAEASPFTTDAWEFGLAGVPGAQGPAGPAGPTGPTGPEGPGADIVVLPPDYTNLGGLESVVIFSVCPAGTAIAASCGYNSHDENYHIDEDAILIHYVGYDQQDSGTAECRVGSSSPKSIQVMVAATCLEPVSSIPVIPIPSATQQVIKSCTYDPDTERPCTEADAKVYDKATAMAEAEARAARRSQSGPDTGTAVTDPVTGAKKKVHREVTLHFLSPR